MKLPNNMKKKLSKAADLHREAAGLVGEVEAYLESVFGDTENLTNFNHPQPWWRSGDGTGLDEIDLGNDVSEQFSKAFEIETRDL